MELEAIRQDVKYIKKTVDEIKEQAKLTNGRVKENEMQIVRIDTMIKIVAPVTFLIISIVVSFIMNLILKI